MDFNLNEVEAPKSFISRGVHTGGTVTNVDYVEPETGKPYMSIDLTNQEGESANSRYYFTTDGATKVSKSKVGQLVAATLDSNMKVGIDKAKSLYTKVTTFEAFLTVTQKALVGKRVNFRVVGKLNKGNGKIYNQLPDYNFVEFYTEGKPSRLTYDPNTDDAKVETEVEYVQEEIAETVDMPF